MGKQAGSVVELDTYEVSQTRVPALLRPAAQRGIFGLDGG